MFWLLRSCVSGAERGSRDLHVTLKYRRERVRATQHAPRGSFRLLKCFHGLAEIGERGTGVQVERPRVNVPHFKRKIMRVTKDASRHGHRLVQQRLGFCEAL